jgi:hypothetical protein
MDNNLAQKFIKSHMDLSLLHAHNLAQSVKKFAKSDFALCSKDISEDRHSVCQSCEKFDANEMFGLGKCLECGCCVWPKVRMASESCPLGKWQSATISQENDERLDV